MNTDFFKKEKILEMLENMADAAVQIEHEQIAEMRDAPDQYAGLSRIELEDLIKNYPRMVDHNTEANSTWDVHSMEGRGKIGTSKAPYVKGEKGEILPYSIVIHDAHEFSVLEGECPHTARMQAAVDSAQDIEFELSSGDTVSLDPHTLQMLINKKKCVSVYSHLTSPATFASFLRDVYGHQEPHDHSGNGSHSDVIDTGAGE